MTQIEKLIARLKTLDKESLSKLLIYVNKQGEIVFWMVENAQKVEGEVLQKANM